MPAQPMPRRLPVQPTAWLAARSTGILVTDTVPIHESLESARLEVLSVAGLLAETIANVFANESVSAIFVGENQLF